MAVINTTNVIDNSIFLKAKLAPNMVGDNYYIENLQDKRDEDWEYRYNRVWIEEEKSKPIAYEEPIPLTEITSETSAYQPIDVVITDVKGDKGEPLGTDWASLAFRDLKHPNAIGNRYRFSTDFPDLRDMTEEQKHYDLSTWIAVNRAPIPAGNSCVVRRCNTTLTLLGYENRDRRKSKTREIHLEPAILERNDFKYTQIYYNETLPVPQAEWYVIVQLNYYTNNIKVNDRFIFGTLDNEVRDNNTIFKVKAVVKASSKKTFLRENSNGTDEEELKNTPLLFLGLDRDSIATQDNFKTRVANNAPVYAIPTQDESKKTDPSTQDKYVLKNAYSATQHIALGDTQTYKMQLFCNDVEISNPSVTYEVVLNGKTEAEREKYCRVSFLTGEIGFTVTNLKTWLGGTLDIKVIYNIPGTTETIDRTINISLDKA